MLSFEWYLDGEPVVVDTGVYEYEPGPMRHYVRSTAAHNTVHIHQVLQSETGRVPCGQTSQKRCMPI